MKIQTKYNIGDEVYAVIVKGECAEILKVEIWSIVIQDENEISYSFKGIDNDDVIPERHLGHTPSAAAENFKHFLLNCCQS